MGRFLASFWRGVTAAKEATGNILFLALFLIIVVSLVSTDVTTVDDRSALVINPTGVVVEQLTVNDPVSSFLSGYDDANNETLLRDILTAISSAAEDPRITALVLDLSGMRYASMSSLEDIGTAVREFRESGKPTYAWGDGYTQQQYYIAAHADTVLLNQHAFNPLGGVFLTGLGIYPTYFASALDSLKVNFHIFKAGQFKAFVEPYLLDGMSDEAKEANAGLIDVLWNQYTTGVVRERDMTAEALAAYSDRFDELLAETGGDSYQLALDTGLVDALVSREEFRAQVRAHTEQQDETFRQVNFRDYLAATGANMPVINPASDKVAVITASGTIYDGEQPPGVIGSESVARLIRNARNDDRIRAVVIRIDSPGGSASASELIRHELSLTQAAGKPVVASMGGAAASGGYWIASTSNRIFARATTMTGSIGAFIMFPTFNESLAELGIFTDGVGTTNLSNALDPFQPMNPVLKRTLDQSIIKTYERFIGIVAEGREMAPEDVDKVAQGRVWAGATAVELGLVDSIGDLGDAIESAAVLASLGEYDVVYLEKELSAREQLLKQLMNTTLKTAHGLYGDPSGGVYSQFLKRLPAVDLKAIGEGPGLYSHCLYCRIAY